MTGAHPGIASAIARTDHVRGSPAPYGGERGWKEWLHFCIHAPGVDLLVNFSRVDETRNGASARDRASRVIVLYRDARGSGAARWEGGIDRYAEEDVTAPSGRVAVRMGESAVRFQGGVYELRAKLRGAPFEVAATLVPLTYPAPRFNVSVGDGPPIHWVVAPRLSATGTVGIGGLRTSFEGVPAYHDHNFGHFRWGRDFAWEWGFALPPDAEERVSAVFVRLSDRAHTRARAQALFLWRGVRQHRVFRDGDLRIRHEGLLAPPRMFKLPRPMALLAPGVSSDVPRRLVFEGAAAGDRASGVFEAEDVAQVIIPNDDDLGVTIIHEVAGTLGMEGAVRGEAFAWSGRAVFEFLGS